MQWVCVSSAFLSRYVMNKFYWPYSLCSYRSVRQGPAIAGPQYCRIWLSGKLDNHLAPGGSRVYSQWHLGRAERTGTYYRKSLFFSWSTERARASSFDYELEARASRRGMLEPSSFHLRKARTDGSTLAVVSRPVSFFFSVSHTRYTKAPAHKPERHPLRWV